MQSRVHLLSWQSSSRFARSTSTYGSRDSTAGEPAGPRASTKANRTRSRSERKNGLALLAHAAPCRYSSIALGRARFLQGTRTLRGDSMFGMDIGEVIVILLIFVAAFGTGKLGDLGGVPQLP